jgi:hypothetical protein
MPFVYSSNALDVLSKTIAKDRLLQYITHSKGDIHKAMMMYERNTVLSQGLYGVLQPLEIAFRNAIHRVMTTDTGKSNWYYYAPLNYREDEAVKAAKANILRWSRAVTPGRMVAELTFGFWLRLLDTSYEKTLWVPHLYKAFPNLSKPDRATIFDRLYSIKTLRNRIAHHEPVIFRNLNQDYSNAIEAIEWICHTTAAWVRATNTFQRDFSN